MSKEKKVAIIGGGASGLLCAIFCAKKSILVDVYEQNSKCAKKILASGNGRCNITNTNLTCNDYFSQNHHFVDYALKEFGFSEFEKFCQNIGLLLDVKDDGRVYPLSNEAKSVASLLIAHAKNLGVNFHTDTKITDIKKLFNDYDSVVVATGSEAASQLGGNSDGYNFAMEFGHNIIPTYPSLVQLHLNSKIVKKMSGAKVDGEVTLLINNKKELTPQGHFLKSACSGDILFSDYGVSGFAILDISQAASKALMEKVHVSISINLLPKFDLQKLSNHISKIAAKEPKITIFEILIGLIPMKIASAILEDLGILASTCADEINVKLSKKIANQLLNWRFEVTDTHGFRHAEVSGGGVDTTEINPKTMESLKQKNLYFCGEVLDVVGRRGGYNFAFAWASGFLAARDITKH
ncbi:NAD(P)/FAD-dependent oxidoreductase [Sulfurimonas sp.]|uniref:NAD(P)/FAD-dependent oxidoreductase n=1 Tax=Sulfurimonas sp. TaxID=2022749 RepID=UPI002606CA53|nr:NAD(P)/FAD-dependent oxidoreductase [Sulfurimonas sp.]MDD3855700.1 NAD(P)/FAD-dependent oxidoreductase [Sulfurimonas sp.]